MCSGLVATIRGIPFRMKYGDLPLPLDLCIKHNLVQEKVFRQGPEAPGLKDVVFEIATRANDHLNTAREYIEDTRNKSNNLLKFAFCVFLPVLFKTFIIVPDGRLHQGTISRFLKGSISTPLLGHLAIGS